MKKKGFTLVELLAVIAILAILVIIALPNVMGMFNQAKQNSFTTEVKEIFKQAEQQWISDSMLSTQEVTYWRFGGDTGASVGNGIQLTGRTQLDYYIKVNKSGKIVEYYATDGSYQYVYVSSTGLLVEQIDDGKTVNGEKLALNGTTGFKVDSSSSLAITNNKVFQVSSLATGNTMSLYEENASTHAKTFKITLK